MANAARAAKLSAAINKAFGEDFTFTARKHAADVDLPRAADPARAEFTAQGAWAAGSRTKFPRAAGEQSDDRAQAAVRSAPRAVFADADMAWTPVEGDLCLRVETGETYAVARTLPNGFGRTTIYFTARKR